MKYKIQNNTLRRIIASLAGLVLAVTLGIGVLFVFSSKKAEASWWHHSWRFRKRIPISYSGSTALSEYQVLIDGFDTATLITNGKMQSDCGDIRFVTFSGRLLDYSIVGNTCNTSDTEIWVKVDTIPSNNNTAIFMYYGNSSASNYESERNTFSYSSEKTVGYVLSDRFTSLDVISLESSNSITHNSSTLSLGRYSTGTFTPSNYNAVTAKKLFYIDADQNGTDTIVPVSWAGTEFVYRTRTSAKTPEWFVVSPWGTATVRLYKGGTEQTACGSPWTVTSAGTSFTCSLGNNQQYRITSDIPILASYEGNTTDVYPLYPATTENLYGFRSNDFHISANANGADYRYITSGDISETNPADLSADASIKYDVGGNYFSTNPVMTYSATANGNISAQQIADGDGSDATVHVGRREFGTIFGSANQADYVAVVSDQEATCTVYDTDGSTLETKTLTSSNTSVYGLPSSTDFGTGSTSTFTTGAWHMECDKPVYAFYQHSSTNDEKNMWSYPSMRQYVYPAPSVGTLGSEELSPDPVLYWKFDSGEGTTAEDSTNKNKDGTLTNNPSWVEQSCISGKCLQFDGSSSYVVRADDNDLDFSASDSFTIQAWVRVPTSVSSQQDIITKYESTGLDGGYTLRMESDGDISFGIDDANGNFVDDIATTATADYDDGNWHLITGVKTGTTKIELYVDGILVASDSSIASTGTLANNDPFYVGIGGDGTSNPWKGFIDEVKVYPYARSSEEIKNDYIFQGTRGSNVTMGSSTFSLLQNRLTQGLVGYWKLDESSGNASDSSGNNNTLTDVNSTSFVMGRYGNGADFESSLSQYQNLSTVSPLEITSDLTLSAWIKPESNTASTQYDIVGKWDGANETYLLSQYGDEIRFYLDSSSNYITTDSVNLVTGNWYHVVGVYDAHRQTADIYVNGKLKTSTTTGTIPSSLGLDSGKFHIGAEDSSSTATNFYDGIIDEVRVYNRRLSPKEVRALYHFAPGPILYYNFDENTGTSTVYDTSSNGNNGTMNGSMTEGDWVPGKYGSALDFDGNDDYIEIGNSQAVDNGEQGTIEAWIYPRQNGSFNAPQNIFSYGGGAQGNAGRFFFTFGCRTSNYSSLCFENQIGGSTTQYIVYTSSLNLNQWYHVALTSDGSTWKMYINGVEQSLSGTSNVGNWFADANLAGTVHTTIGAKYWNGAWQYDYFNGKIDDIRIYNYARTPGQIVEDMNGGHNVGGSPVGSQMLYINFDEGYGTTLYDQSVNANNGTISGASWTNSGKYGKALTFTSGTDYAYVPDDPSISGLSEVTLSVWVYPTSWPTSCTGAGTGCYIFIAGKSNWSSEREYRMRYEYENGGATNQIVWYVDKNGTGSVQGTDYEEIAIDPSKVPVNTWTHLLGTWDSTTGAMNFYVNGVLEGSTTFSASSLYDGTANFGIGSSGDNGSSGTADDFIGRIDELKVYNTALTADQVKTEYNQGKAVVLGSYSTSSDGTTADWSSERSYCPPGDTTSSCSPILEWKLDENTGTSTVYDTSSNGNNGTMNGSMTEGDWVPGKYGSALDLDGSDDYISRAYDSDFDFGTGSFTVTTWIKHDTQTGTSGTLDLSVSASSDDGSEENDTTWYDQTSGDNYAGAGYFEVGYDPIDSAFRFNNVTIPQGATITTATLKTYAVGYYNSGRIVETVIKGIAEDNTATFSQSNRPSQRSKTTGVTWDIDIDNEWVPLNSYKSSPEIKSIIQAIVNRPGWSSGNSLAIVWEDNGAASGDGIYGEDYDNTGANSPQLHIEYTTISADSLVSRYNAAGWKLYMQGDGTICFGIDDDSTWDPDDSACSSSAYDDNAWHKVTAIKNGTTGIYLYIDGTQVASDTSLTATGSLSGTSPVLYYGVDSDGSSTFWDGVVDNLEIYNYALSSSQIAWHLNKNMPNAWYKFDECTGTTLYDASENANGDANGNNGTISIGSSGTYTSAGTCSSGTASEMWNAGTTGKVNSALALDGTDDYASLPITIPTGDFTYSAWVKLDTASDETLFMATDSSGGNELLIYFASSSIRGVWLNGSHTITNFDNITTDTWYHIAVTRSGSTVTAYVNGAVDGTGTDGTVLSFGGGCELLVGVDADGLCNASLGNYLDGLVDDVRIYNYALTQKQIQSIYNQGAVRFE